MSIVVDAAHAQVEYLEDAVTAAADDEALAAEGSEGVDGGLCVYWVGVCSYELSWGAEVVESRLLVGYGVVGEGGRYLVTPSYQPPRKVSPAFSGVPVLVGSDAVAYTLMVLVPVHSAAENVRRGVFRIPSSGEMANMARGSGLVVPSARSEGDRNVVFHGISPSVRMSSDIGLTVGSCGVGGPDDSGVLMG